MFSLLSLPELRAPLEGSQYLTGTMKSAYSARTNRLVSSFTQAAGAKCRSSASDGGNPAWDAVVNKCHAESCKRMLNLLNRTSHTQFPALPRQYKNIFQQHAFWIAGSNTNRC
ncbi:unnamed protein product [Nesidiocoris tenuis]|uniref:Uncharacterized protein n=1 Tax=Nesidiocoris tenuis TaxID=355587 RepID=A0A6H5HIR6_9HEMI|nr:unnamed protein product [Nesidiocoris tenuis]